MWIHVANTKNNPRVLAKHCLDCVRYARGKPCISIFKSYNNYY